MKFLASVFAVCFVGSVQAAPIEAYLNQETRLFRNSGFLVLRDPYTDQVMGTYQFVTGGSGRGSAPFGYYELGEFLTRGWLGPRWLIHHIGLEDGMAWDPIVGLRTELELHASHGYKYTLGCISILGGPQVWADFQKELQYIQAARGRVVFRLGTSNSHLAAK